MSQSPQDVYARYLLSSRGYPLWVPEPSQQLLLSRPDGLRIGDVGVVVPEDGGFDVFFNICLPREHPFHRVTGVPDNFEVVEVRDEDIRIIPRVENPGRIISTSAVTKIRTVRPPDSDDSPSSRSGGLGYEFDLSSSGGALLILPEGADRYDLRNRRLFFEKATQHGVDWYHFAEERLGRMISHDSLYLITGFYKTRSWSVAAFENATGSGEFSAQFKMAQIGGSHIAGTYTWETTRSLDWRVGPAENYGFPNQSVFIRGFKVALRTDFSGKKRVKVKADAPGTSDKQIKFTSALKRDSWISNVWKGLSRNSRSGAGMENDEVLGPTTDRALGDHLSREVPDDAEGKHVVVQHVPELSEIFHPSDIINRYLFEKAAFARIAVTHDDDWISLFNEGQLKSEDFMQASASRVEEVVAQNFHVVSQNGVVFLQGTKHATRSQEILGDPQVPVVSGTEQNPDSDAGNKNVPIDRLHNPPHIAVQEKRADQPPAFPSIRTQDEKIHSLMDAEAPPAYETINPYWHEPTDRTKKSLLDTTDVPASTQFPDIHWMLRAYDPQTSKRLVRFDVMFPVDHICYQYHNNVRKPLTDQDLDEPASTDPITEMRITFAQQPFSWTIKVDNPRRIRCRDVFEAIYDCFNRQLTLGELWRVPDRDACDKAFRIRTLVRRSQTERSLGWKRVDTLLHHTIFHGLTMNADGEWVLNMGAPLPAGNLGKVFMADVIKGKICASELPLFQTRVPLGMYSAEAEGMQTPDPAFPTIPWLPPSAQLYGLSPSHKLSPRVDHGMDQAEAEHVQKSNSLSPTIPVLPYSIPALPYTEEPSSLSMSPKLSPNVDLIDAKSIEVSPSQDQPPTIIVLPPRQSLTRPARKPKGPRSPKQR